MSIQVPRVAQTDVAELSAVQQRPHPDRAHDARHLKRAEAVKVDTTPIRPPAEVLREIEAAAARWKELQSQQRELHFTHDETANRVVVEVRDKDGNVLRTVPPSKALEIIAGAPVE